jgi:hypothetical protein
MLTDFIKINPSEPQNFQKKNSSTFYDNTSNLPTPKIEITLKKRQENLSELIPIIKNEFKSCEFDSITSEIKENVSINGIKRNFEINGQIPLKNSLELNEFKNDLFSSLTNTNSFFDIDDNECWKIEETQSKGQKFESPKLFNIDGNETNIKLPQKDCIIFIYENNSELNYIIDKIKKIPIIFVCKTNNFLQRKKSLIENGILSEHYFFCEGDNAFNGLKLPRLIIINEKGQVYENRSLNNINELNNLEETLLYQNEENNNEYENLNTWWLKANNEIKTNVIYTINRELEEAGFNNVNFEINTSFTINNKGIDDIRVVPILRGFAPKKKEKDLIKFIESIESEVQLEKIENLITLN